MTVTFCFANDSKLTMAWSEKKKSKVNCCNLFRCLFHCWFIDSMRSLVLGYFSGKKEQWIINEGSNYAKRLCNVKSSFKLFVCQTGAFWQSLVILILILFIIYSFTLPSWCWYRIYVRHLWRASFELKIEIQLRILYSSGNTGTLVLQLGIWLKMTTSNRN